MLALSEVLSDYFRYQGMCLSHRVSSGLLLCCRTRASEHTSEDHGFLWIDSLPVEAGRGKSLIFAMP